MMRPLDNVCVVLCDPSGSMNIGQTARAMKNCDITDLRIVAGKKINIGEAHMMAMSAKDIVDSAKRFDTLPEAVADCTCALAMSRRVVRTRAPFYSIEEMAPKVIERAAKGKVALVFGSERDGLSHEQVYQCDYRVYIPTSETYGSLNLAQAVVLTCHRVFSAYRETQPVKKDEFFAPRSEVEVMLNDFEKMLSEIGYNHRGDVRLRAKIMQATKEIYGRAGLRHKDVNMLIGIFAQIRKAIEKGGKR